MPLHKPRDDRLPPTDIPHPLSSRLSAAHGEIPRDFSTTLEMTYYARNDRKGISKKIIDYFWKILFFLLFLHRKIEKKAELCVHALLK